MRKSGAGREGILLGLCYMRALRRAACAPYGLAAGGDVAGIDRLEDRMGLFLVAMGRAWG